MHVIYNNLKDESIWSIKTLSYFYTIVYKQYKPDETNVVGPVLHLYVLPNRELQYSDQLAQRCGRLLLVKHLSPQLPVIAPSVFVNYFLLYAHI